MGQHPETHSGLLLYLPPFIPPLNNREKVEAMHHPTLSMSMLNTLATQFSTVM